ncbi:carboxymuconolactone decarboxylase family protein [Mycolicibacterium iranicum]|jgi:alkylhydroperoxidase family enzyme|uniref:Carboxymuconolactone decarboxylase n=1 Tax=Mycolicibacterium iranicum TaxID=912594 RepID=A0A1X1X2M9_MYCIR|nr:carboxymuconolactone decarboxylase family protein [Mycolicibacterium iranicum]ORV93147.1 carboxymuconolactone decarboxylase [Mycolicibacterium iranicum]
MQPLSAEEWSEAEYAAFGTLMGIPGEKVPRAGSGHAYEPLNFPVIGLLARHPTLAQAFLTFNVHLLRHGELPADLRELVVLRVAIKHRSAFEWGQHVKFALATGVTEEEISALVEGNEGFTGHRLLVLQAADELLATGRAGSTWEQLVDQLGVHQAMEVLFLVGAYITTGMAFNTWGLQPQPGSAALPADDDAVGGLA